MEVIACRSTFFFVVISIAVLILAFVSEQGQNATGGGDALYKAKCGAAFKETLSEDQTELLVAHIRE